MISRRRFLQGAAALAVSPALRAQGNPFPLGVASGYPASTGMVLWTRLLGLAGAQPVSWEIAEDEAMRRIVQRGETTADPAWAHSVHVEPEGLRPDRWYWYRFTAAGAQSPVGRTRTAPLPSARPSRLRFAFASCQHWEQGYFSAYRPMLADEPDLIAFLGDYIYETTWGKELVRSHGATEPFTLEDYRARYALYRSEPELQAAHAACPWIVTWDDHEVVNDYADDRAADGLNHAEFLARRAAAYRAYYEHMPLPARMRPDGPRMRLYTQLGWGALARFYLLDCRQYRSWQACPRPGRRGGSNTVNVDDCPQLADEKRTMLGRRQERWLDAALGASRAGWNVIAQTTLMARLDQLPGPGRRAWTDGWDGYPAARKRLLASALNHRVLNPVVIGGDVHSFNVAQLKLDYDDPASPVIASEFVGTSITSQAWPQERVNELLPDNPHILYAESRYRGYTRVEITEKAARFDLRGMESVRVRDAACNTLASFVVESGKPGPLKAG